MKAPLERQTVVFDWPDPHKGDYVTVKVRRSNPPTPPEVFEIGWNRRAAQTPKNWPIPRDMRDFGYSNTKPLLSA